mgnify:CR=1 FL=1
MPLTDTDIPYHATMGMLFDKAHNQCISSDQRTDKDVPILQQPGICYVWDTLRRTVHIPYITLSHKSISFFYEVCFFTTEISVFLSVFFKPINHEMVIVTIAVIIHSEMKLPRV